ncbi:PIN domain-containing protein [Deinococcus sp.]|uniref:PIN domain-containing protein n=1 Tax=Deinococcus sp. TaxID=47478 RepID=UPI003B5BABF7
MRNLLLDASALIAFIRREPGGETVLQALMDGKNAVLVGSVQLVEVEGKLVSDGSFTPQQVRARIRQLGQVLDVVAFNAQAQDAAGFYYARRKPYDLSLGDALCLGLAEVLKADVMTAKRGWASLPDIPFGVQLIR